MSRDADEDGEGRPGDDDGNGGFDGEGDGGSDGDGDGASPPADGGAAGDSTDGGAPVGGTADEQPDDDESPTGDAAAGESPTGDAAAGDSPTGDSPAGEPAADDAAAGEPAADDAVAGEPAADDATGGEPAGTDADADTADSASDLPPVEELTGDVRRLDPRVRLVWVVRAGVAAFVLGGLAAGAGFVFGPRFWPGPVAFALAFAVGVGHAFAHYRRWRYQVRADALHLDRGVVTRVATVVPHVRIQHVDVSRGPMERALGLSSVVVYTAGSRGADVTVPGLPVERADDLQSRLKGLAIAAEGEDAV